VTALRSLGVDVAEERKGLDAVLLDQELSTITARRRLKVSDIGPLIDETRPDVVAIDSPPQFGSSGGGYRRTELELMDVGIRCFGTPSDRKKADNPFYRWMAAGFQVFEAAAERGFSRYQSGPVRGTAIEVYPHASAVVLAGCLQPTNAKKRVWRAGILAAQGVSVDGLRSADQVDAALAALTGLFALRGKCFAPGHPTEGVIVLPARSLPVPPYRRCREDGRPDEVQLHFRGLGRCACGDPECSASTTREFAPGHDAKRKSTLWKLARSGQEAVDELRRRGWEVPPELR